MGARLEFAVEGAVTRTVELPTATARTTAAPPSTMGIELPEEVYAGLNPANEKPRYEPRAR